MKRVNLEQPMWEKEKEKFNKIIKEHAIVHGSSGGFPICPLYVDCTISDDGLKLLAELGVVVN